MQKFLTRKAIVAFALPFVGALGAAMSDGNLTLPEAITALGFGLVTGATVYRVPNAE